MKKNKKYLLAAKKIRDGANSFTFDGKMKWKYICHALDDVKQNKSNLIKYFKPDNVLEEEPFYLDHAKNMSNFNVFDEKVFEAQLSKQLALLFLYEMGVK